VTVQNKDSGESKCPESLLASEFICSQLSRQEYFSHACPIEDIGLPAWLVGFLSDGENERH
jgi:hypothetical protein